MAPLVQKGFQDHQGTKVSEGMKASQAMTDPKGSLGGQESLVRRERRAEVASQVFQASLASLVLLDCQDQRAPWVLQGFRASRAMLVHVESQVCLGSHPHQASLDHRDPREHRAIGERRVHQDHLGFLALLVPQEILGSWVSLDPRDTLDCRVKRENQGRMESKEREVLWDHRAPEDLQDLQVQVDFEAVMGQVASQDSKDPLVPEGFQGLRDHQAH